VAFLVEHSHPINQQQQQQDFMGGEDHAYSSRLPPDYSFQLPRIPSGEQ